MNLKQCVLCRRWCDEQQLSEVVVQGPEGEAALAEVCSTCKAALDAGRSVPMSDERE